MKPGSRLRILLIIDSYPPHLGGSEIEAQRVSAGLIRRGHQVEVLCAGGPPMPRVREWTDPEGVPVSILTRNSRGSWKDRVFALEVARQLWRRRKRYDIVYFLMQGLQVASGLPVARLLGKPMAMKIAGSGVIPLMRSSRAGRWELDWMRDWRITLLLLNEGMMEEAVADGFAREQLVWMPNPVDVAVFRPATPSERLAWRAGHGLAADARVAVYVGRLSREKGLPGLLKGFAVAARQVPDSVLLLVGDGPIRADLEALAAELALEPGQIRFAGRAAISDVPGWLTAADAFALTSPSEGFPCALVEAMAAGLPSVVSAIPANLQLIEDGVHGLTVTWNDAEAIGGALLRLFRDAQLCSAMGTAARERSVANYSMDVVLELYEKLFANIIAGRSQAN
jgi:glycosyltransferase involved in cell wall biosynthesis